MANKRTIEMNMNRRVPFNNRATVCIGTGRMNLALRKEYYDQLEIVQHEIGFSYIRGHGLFCDDMGIYQTYEEAGVERVEYNFTYIDMVFDEYMKLGIKPFVELGFMPEKLASGNQTVFYWKGNVTPPKDYKKWADLIIATINHWIDRYGSEEVVTWPFEVWNEPNLPGFWKNADLEEYFKLYEVSSKAVKFCDPRIEVGGPAICGVDDINWLTKFLDYCSQNDCPLDFVTRHLYAAEMPERKGHYDYQKLRGFESVFDEVYESRKIIDSYPKFLGMKMHITEFNTSYTPQNPIHDTNQNAAYIARLLSQLGDHCASYSYWTFGDVFEENGISFTPFSGGFGLLANGKIPKPTFWTFDFFSQLYKNTILRNDLMVVTVDEQERVKAVLWNNEEESLELDMNFISDFAIEDRNYVFVTHLVDESCCNPLKTWLDIGSPSSLSKAQKKLITQSSYPMIRTDQLKMHAKALKVNLTLQPNAVCLVELYAVDQQIDRGFDITRILPKK